MLLQLHGEIHLKGRRGKLASKYGLSSTPTSRKCRYKRPSRIHPPHAALAARSARPVVTAQFGDVVIEIKPCPRLGFVFEDRISVAWCPSQFYSGPVEKESGIF